MGNLIAAVMASAILGVVAAPIMALSLQQVKDRADSQLSLDAEAKALAVRKQAAAADSLAIVDNTLELTTNGLRSIVDLPEDCTVSEDVSLGISKVTCRSSNGSRVGTNTQPLYTAADFVAAATLCYSSYRSNAALNADNPNTTSIATIDEFNTLLTAAGNSTGTGGGFFTKLHPLSDPDCAQAQANGGTYTHSSQDGGNNNSSGSNGNSGGSNNNSNGNTNSGKGKK